MASRVEKKKPNKSNKQKTAPQKQTKQQQKSQNFKGRLSRLHDKTVWPG